MKFKMAEKSLFAILRRSPWWVSVLAAGLVGVVATALLPSHLAAAGMLGGMPFLVIGGMVVWRQWNAPKPALVAHALAQCAAMSWTDFAAALERGFSKQGYAVTRLNGVAADFALEKNGRMVLVACRRWKAATLGMGVVTDLLAQKAVQGAQDCTCICLGAATDNAHRFAREQGIYLMPEHELAQLLMA